MTGKGETDLTRMKEMLERAGIDYEFNQTDSVENAYNVPIFYVTIERGYVGLVSEIYFRQDDESLLDICAYE